MQLKIGTVTVTSGSARVIGDVNCDWTQVVAGASWFSLVAPDATVYTVAAKADPAHSGSGFWEVTLNGNFVGTTASGQQYVIHKDFTLNRNLPLFSPGDTQSAQIFSRAMQILDVTSTLAYATALPINTLILPKPSLVPIVTQVGGNDAFQLWLLQGIAPVTGDTATADDPNSRWRQVA